MSLAGLALFATPALAEIDEDGNWRGDVRVYARHCGEVVGAQIPDFNCERDGVEIPITVNGQRIRSGARPRCDRPAFMAREDDACRTGSRLGRLHFDDPDIETVFICRRAAETEPNGRIYEEIAIIHHNQRNGATCWNLAGTLNRDGPLLSGDVRSPASSESANGDGRHGWLMPHDLVCSTCHQPDPFLFTPYVEQVRAGGERVMPGFYDGPDGLDPRFWNPLSGFADLLRGDRFVFGAGTDAAICTSCHAIGNGVDNTTRPKIPFLAESLGLGSADPTSGDRQNRKATNPTHGWMHLEHPALRPPFALMPRTVGANPVRRSFAVRDINACLNGDAEICDRIPFRGRPQKDIAFSPDFDLTAAEPGMEHAVMARQRNHDLGDAIRISIRHGDGRFAILKDRAGFDEAVPFSPDCEPGGAVELTATLIDEAGDDVKVGGRPVTAQRRIACLAPQLTRWIPGARILQSVPDMTLSGSVVGPVGLFPSQGLVLGDRNNNESQRAFLTFPIKPHVAGAAPVRAVLLLPLDAGAGDPRTLGDIVVTHYRYGSALDGRDFNSASAPRQGRARIANAGAVATIDVTDHVASAWRDGDDRVQLGVWYETLTDGDRRFDTSVIRYDPRGDGAGRLDFRALRQPMLTITYD